MKTMKELIRYQYRQYMLSGKYILPLITLLAVISVMYTVTPVGVVSSFSMMSLFLFLIMVWVGVVSQEIEPEVSEQIIILRLQSERIYYTSQILFMGMVSAVATGISIGVPMLNHILHGGGVFGRGILLFDVIGGFLLMCVCSFNGAMAGGIFHPRIVRDRKIGMGATFFLALLVIVRIAVIHRFPVSKFVLWLVPPVSDVVSRFSNQEYFNMGKIMIVFGVLMGYGVIMAVLRVELLRIRKFV